MKLAVRTKMILAFLSVLVLTGITGAVGISGMAQITDLDKSLYDSQLMGLYHVDKAMSDLLTIGRDIRHAIIFVDEKDTVDSMLREIDALTAETDENLRQMEPLMTTADGRSKLATMKEKSEAYKSGLKPIVERVRTGDSLGAVARLKDFSTAVDEAVAAFEVMQQQKQDRGRQAMEENMATAATLRNLLIGVILAALLLGMGVAWFLSRAISNGVSAVGRAAKQIADVDLPRLAETSQAIAWGDLTKDLSITCRPVDVKSRDEIGEMAKAFNDMVSRLVETGEAFGQMTSNLRSTEEMSSQVEEMVAQAQHLSAMAEELQAIVAQFKTSQEDGVVLKRRQDDWGGVRASERSQDRPNLRPVTA